jgi:hypothetical protein
MSQYLYRKPDEELNADRVKQIGHIVQKVTVWNAMSIDGTVFCRRRQDKCIKVFQTHLASGVRVVWGNTCVSARWKNVPPRQSHFLKDFKFKVLLLPLPGNKLR